jgi:hypothetical protein
MRHALIAIALASAAAASAQKADVSQVDAILDRLERRLLDQETEGLTFSEKNAPPAPLSDKTPVSVYKGEKTRIEASSGTDQRLKDVGRLVTELEQQVDQLAGNVQKTKQNILDDAAIDNFVSLDASLPDTDQAAIKSIVVKLDGFKLYQIDDAAGLWLPSKSIPLYAGPLQPGNHRIDLEARISMREARVLPVSGQVYRFINKSFQWSVPGGQTNARYTITIIPPDKLDGVADAKLQESL